MNRFNTAIQNYIKIGGIALVCLTALNLVLANIRKENLMNEISSMKIPGNIPIGEFLANKDGISDANQILYYDSLLDWIDNQCPENKKQISILSLVIQRSFKKLANQNTSVLEAIKFYGEQVQQKNQGENCYDVYSNIRKQLKGK
jgi:hypothetical protein